MFEEILKKRGWFWLLLNSLHIILASFMGFTSWIAFLYMYIRTRKKGWLISALFYFLSAATILYLTNLFPDEKTRPSYFNFIITVYLLIWVFSILHILFSLKEFLLRINTLSEVSKEKEGTLSYQIKKEYGIIKNPIDETLSEFKENDTTVKIARFIFDNLPVTPEFLFYTNLREAARRYNFDYSNEREEKIINIAKYDENLHKIIKTGKAIDKIDAGLGIFTGLQNTYQKIKKTNQRTFESDPQQAIDAATKAIALGYMIHLSFDENKIQNFLKLHSGIEILSYFLTIELALPFTDNFLEEGGKALYKLIQQNERQIESKFSSFAGETSFLEAKTILERLENQIQSLSSTISQSLKPFEETLSNKLPSILNIMDSVAGGISTSLDILPFWKFLSARLAAESAIYKSIKI